jgi:hypothetical protein
MVNYCIAAAFTEVFSETRLLATTEGCRHVRFIVGIYENGTSCETIGDGQGFADVAREYTRCQAVFRGISPSYDTVNVTTPNKSRSTSPLSFVKIFTAI